MVWSYLVNLVNVSSLYWQATFARRCLFLRLTWFRQCACFGVELHSLNMSSVMSRVSNGVGCGSLLAIDQELAVSLERRSSRRGGVGAIILVTAEKYPGACHCRQAPENVGQVGTGRAPARVSPAAASRQEAFSTQPSLGTAGQSAEFLRNGTSRRDCRSSNRRRLRRLPPETADKIAERVKSLEMAV